MCIIEISGEIHYACCTKPEDGMRIIFQREDLKEIRMKRIFDYARERRNNNHDVST
ncbi:hypothetical protein ACFLYK_03350 [Candidatus Cloacimonadota bacterium]